MSRCLFPILLLMLFITPLAYAGLDISYSTEKDLLTVRDDGYTMMSSPPDWKSVNDYWDSRIRSMFIVEYWDRGLENSRMTFSYDAKRSVKYTGKTIEIEYRFPDIGLSFTSVIENRDDCFLVKIPDSTFRENENYPVIGITFLPYLNAGRVGERGYIVIPDGCGTMIQFNKFFGVTTLEKSVYGDLTPSNYNINNIPVTMPLFSCIKNNLGFAGIISEGKEFSGLVMDMAPGNGYYSIGTEFYYRKIFEDVYRKKRITQRRDNKDRSILFYLLKDESASYMGVGRTYREYLLKEKKIKTLKEKVKKYNYIDPDIIDINIFMGIKRGFQLFDPVIKLTTFKDIGWMLNRLKSLGIKANLILTGWERSGFEGENPVTFPPFDGLRGFKAIVDKAKASGSFISLSVNYFEIYQNSRDFYRRMTLKSPVKLPVEQSNYRNGFIICPEVAMSKFQKFYSEAKKNGVTDVELRRLGRGLIECFDDEHPADRFESARIYSEMMENAKIVDGGCDYGVGGV
ncbi:MAG TPA: DUF5696 domain-containing protein, partial [bacterium]|nr:DUF5696 domain-containing protein [bacterium]